ncbi:MAG: anhydro-N-acetylmuramic acid kinase, partial [Tenericutes bacterium HGW-Tenericutes-8]
TLQLGDGSVIANQTGIDTVYNFRVADMAVGGQGAPLVPYADYMLFKSNTKNRALHNLGGISNLTILEKAKPMEAVIAFDTGPANMMIDYAMQSLFQTPFDKNGEVAKAGDVIIDLLDTLLANPFFQQQPPKSTGRELFGDTYTAALLKTYEAYDKKDIIATLTEFTILTIMDAYQNLVDIPLDEIIFSGGGANNTYLMERLQEALYPIQVLKIEDLGFDSKSKEALAFVILGNQTLHRQINNIKRATGAKQSVILGQVCYANKGGSL